MTAEEQKNIQSYIAKISQIPSIENILEVACDITGMGFAAIARVTKSTWIACATKDNINFGLGVGGELKIETTICNEIREHRQAVVIEDVSKDPVYSRHHTPKLYGLQSYISVPIILKNGDFFGTLCAIDSAPAPVNNVQIVKTFSLFAELVAFHLDVQDAVEESEEKLRREQRNAEVRERFIAVLGHDLRNPVNAISNAVQLQLRGNLDVRNKKLARIISDATVRTKGLIDNILDFASGRLGGGIVLNYENGLIIEETFKGVINELRMAWPSREIKTSISIQMAPKADYKRLAQLLSNLLYNALSHGDANLPVGLFLNEEQAGWKFKITNHGKPIPKYILPHLFKPFSRGEIKPGQEGLGLGLFIASEIAKAHGGTISVQSDLQGTVFEIFIPR